MKKLFDDALITLWFLCFTAGWKLTRKSSPMRMAMARLAVHNIKQPEAAAAYLNKDEILFDHNIQLDDGTQTAPAKQLIADQHWGQATCRLLKSFFPGDRSKVRIVDIGCLHGGHSVEFARLGFDAYGLEVRASNIAACESARKRLPSLPNLHFIHDDARNIAQHGPFDVTFCAGLLYHLDDPKAYLNLLGSVTGRMMIVTTHYAPESFLRAQRYHLSPMTEHEGLRGRWYPEFPDALGQDTQEQLLWASWNNSRSFWPTRESLLQTIYDSGFDVVFEQFDYLENDMVNSMRHGEYSRRAHGIFVGIKTK